MCDTLGKIVSAELALFAKNSDRSPNEPQVVEFRAAGENQSKTLRTTHLEIPQAPHRHATLISRPVWMWGAEMGVNDHGVCIGNEAVFTKNKYSPTGLTGMDLLRLGLERGGNAKQGMEVIIELLERYGQGGDCGYDHRFYYDNAFLVMDRQAVYLLETAGKKWAYKQVRTGSISNRLSLGEDGTRYSDGTPYHFAARHLEPLYSHFSGSRKRLRITAGCLNAADDSAGMMAALRTHRDEKRNPLAHGDVASPCMHAGGLIGDQTTASMVVELGKDITVWLTGSSTPCVSLFKPWRFGNEAVAPVFPGGHGSEADAYWRRREAFFRQVVGHPLPIEFYQERNALEEEWRKNAQSASPEQLAELSRQAAAQEEAFYQKWEQADIGAMEGNRRYQRYWEMKTEALKAPARPLVDGD